MTRAQIAGDTMVKYQSQYFPRTSAAHIAVQSYSGIRIEQLFDRVSATVAAFDVILLPVGTNNTKDDADDCMIKFQQLFYDIHPNNTDILPRTPCLPNHRHSSCTNDLSALSEEYSIVSYLLKQQRSAAGAQFVSCARKDWSHLSCKDGVKLQDN